MKRTLTIIGLLTSIAACSLDPYGFHYVDLSDRARIYLTADIVGRPSGQSGGAMATVTARREPAVGGAGAKYYFLVDGDRVANLYGEEQYTFQMPAGQHIVSSQCGLARTDAFFNAEPGKSYIFRIYSTFNETCLVAPMTKG